MVHRQVEGDDNGNREGRATVSGKEVILLNELIYKDMPSPSRMGVERRSRFFPLSTINTITTVEKVRLTASERV